jgi:chitodextrinase
MPPPEYLSPVSAAEKIFPLIRPAVKMVSQTSCPVEIVPWEFNALSDVFLNGNGPATTASPWLATQTYVSGDMVAYNGKHYKARYWTHGDIPGPASPVWDEQPDVNGNPPSWYAEKAYYAGTKVSYAGRIYNAKWWTQGETPGISNAWEYVSPIISSGRPAPYRVSVVNGAPDASGATKNLSWTTEPFTLPANPLADSWHVRINGVVVQQGSSISTAVSACPPDTPSCLPTYRQSGSVTLPKRVTDQVTFWLCKGTTCRPTPRLTWYHHTREVGAPTPTPTP